MAEIAFSAASRRESERGLLSSKYPRMRDAKRSPVPVKNSWRLGKEILNLEKDPFARGVEANKCNKDGSWSWRSTEVMMMVFAPIEWMMSRAAWAEDVSLI